VAQCTGRVVKLEALRSPLFVDYEEGIVDRIHMETRRLARRQRRLPAHGESEQTTRLFAEAPTVVEELVAADAAPIAGQNGDVLHSVDFISRRRADDAQPGIEAPKPVNGL